MSDATPGLSRARKALFAALTSLALLATVEGALRLLYGPPPPPVLVYNTYSERQSWFQEQGGSVSATYIDLDPPAAFPASPPGPRCMFVGGSSVHGGSPDVNHSGEFPALVEAATGVTAVNLGVPGHDSFDHVKVVAAALQWRWSCLVLYMGHNDFGNTYFQARYGDLAGGLQARAQAAAERFQLYVQLNRLLKPPTGSATRRMGLPQSSEGFMTETRFWAALRYLRANTEQMLWMAEKKGVKVIIVSPASSLLEQPAQGPCSEPGCATALYQQALSLRASDPTQAAALLRRARDTDRVPLRAPGAAIDALKEVAAEHGALWVDAEAGLPQESDLAVPKRSLFRDAVHFTVEGHKAMAALVAPAVQQAAGAP